MNVRSRITHLEKKAPYPTDTPLPYFALTYHAESGLSDQQGRVWPDNAAFQHWLETEFMRHDPWCKRGCKPLVIECCQDDSSSFSTC